ncbi:MAG: DivIVA domain-containing protein, partial [Gaiellales bacterium]
MQRTLRCLLVRGSAPGQCDGNPAVAGKWSADPYSCGCKRFVTAGRRGGDAAVARSMAITPAEIRHTPLRRGLFGYKRPDVDDMLDEVVDAYQELWQDRVDLRDQLE